MLQLDFIKLVAVLGLPLLSTILGLFVGNIILFDSLLISAACGYFCYSALAIHPAYCLVASAVLCLVQYYFLIVGALPLLYLHITLAGIVSYGSIRC